MTVFFCAHPGVSVIPGPPQVEPGIQVLRRFCAMKKTAARMPSVTAPAMLQFARQPLQDARYPQRYIPIIN